MGSKGLNTRHVEGRTRENEDTTIELPVPRTKYIGETLFYWGSLVCNYLPLDVHEVPEKNTFV